MRMTEISVETTFCIYCKSILTVDSEKQLGYHQSCAYSFQNNPVKDTIDIWLEKRRRFVYKEPLTIYQTAFQSGRYGVLTGLVLDFKVTTSEVLEEIPEFIDSLSYLDVLFVTKHKLKSVPATIGNLHLLRGLYLNDNSLSSIPESFGNLFNLVRLDLSSNNLTSLPDSFGNLSNQTELYLDRNS